MTTQQPRPPGTTKPSARAIGRFVVAFVAVMGLVTAVALWRAYDRPGQPGDPVPLTDRVLRAVQNGDEAAIAALLHPESDVLAANESHRRQPRPSDLIRGDATLARVLDLQISWTPSQFAPTATNDATFATTTSTVTYTYTVDGQRHANTVPMIFSWTNHDQPGWRLRYVAVPDPGTFTSTWRAPSFTGTEQDPAARMWGVGDCDPNWVAMAQAFDVYAQEQSPACFPDGRSAQSAPGLDPAIRAALDKPAAERGFGFEVRQTQLTLVLWTDAYPLSEWIIDLDGREYVVAVVGAADCTGRVVAAVPA